jgi:hypothetical protein
LWRGVHRTANNAAARFLSARSGGTRSRPLSNTSRPALSRRHLRKQRAEPFRHCGMHLTHDFPIHDLSPRHESHRCPPLVTGVSFREGIFSRRRSPGASSGRPASAGAGLLQSGHDQLRFLGPSTIHRGIGSAPPRIRLGPYRSRPLGSWRHSAVGLYWNIVRNRAA